jgi:uncharacterized membrane protein
VDIVRAYACVMMVFGHTFNDLLNDSIRNSPLFAEWQHFRGLTAPTFLFVSGFAFHVATARYWEDYLRWSPRLWRRLRRVALLLGIGYMLHLPFNNPIQVITTPLTTAQWISWMNVDILQCVAGNLLTLHILIALLRTRRRFLAYVGIAMPLIFLLSPLVWYLNGLAHAPRIWNFYLGGNFNSYFPMVPWVGFMYGGILAAHWHQTRLKDRDSWHGPFFLAGAAAFLFGSLVYWSYLKLPPFLKFPTLAAHSLWLRLGCVVLIFTGISALARKARSVPWIVRLVGSETLTIYWMHLVVIYGSSWNLGLVSRFGRSLDILQAFAVFLPMFLFLVLLVVIKDRILQWWRSRRPGAAPAEA